MDRRQLNTVGPYDAPDRSDLLSHPDVRGAAADQVERIARYNESQAAKRAAAAEARDLAAELSVRAALAKGPTLSQGEGVATEATAPLASPKVVAARVEFARWLRG